MSIGKKIKQILDITRTSVPVVTGKLTVAETLAYISQHAKEYTNIHDVHVTMSDRTFIGVVPLVALYKAVPTTLLAAIAKTPSLVVSPHDTLCHVAQCALLQHEVHIPVVDPRTRRWLGVLDHEELMRLLETELVCPIDPTAPNVRLRSALTTPLLAVVGGVLLAGLVLRFLPHTSASLVIAFLPMTLMVSVALLQIIHNEFMRYTATSIHKYATVLSRFMLVVGGVVLSTLFLLTLFIVWGVHEREALLPLLLIVGTSIGSLGLGYVCALTLSWKLHRTIGSKDTLITIVALVMVVILYLFLASNLLLL